jgi:hypothetical protein
MADLKLPLLSNIATSSLEASFALVKTIIYAFGDMQQL